LMARHGENGSIHFMCMDWRHLYQLLAASKHLHAEEPVCVDERQRRMGHFIDPSTSSSRSSNTGTGRTSITWNWAARDTTDQFLALSGGQHVPQGADRRLAGASDRQASHYGRRCDPRLLQGRGSDPRSVS
jgi:hypothetical protein